MMNDQLWHDSNDIGYFHNLDFDNVGWSRNDYLRIVNDCDMGYRHVY